MNNLDTFISDIKSGCIEVLIGANVAVYKGGKKILKSRVVALEARFAWSVVWKVCGATNIEVIFTVNRNAIKKTKYFGNMRSCTKEIVGIIGFNSWRNFFFMIDMKFGCHR